MNNIRNRTVTKDVLLAKLKDWLNGKKLGDKDKQVKAIKEKLNQLHDAECCWFCGITDTQIEIKKLEEPPRGRRYSGHGYSTGYNNELKPMLADLHKCEECSKEVKPSKMKLRKRQYPETTANNRFHKKFMEANPGRLTLEIWKPELNNMTKTRQKAIADAEAAGQTIIYKE